jgi:DNA mismatch endonuclease (patch repair protein)
MDTRSPEKRRQIMSAVRQRDTKPELELRRALYSAGIRGWRCHFPVPGKPDLSWPGLKLAVFVDGAFWHGHPSRHKPGRSGSYWDTKIAGNVARDRRVDEELARDGWKVVRLWDFEVERDTASAVQKIVNFLARSVSPGKTAPAWQRSLPPVVLSSDA